MYSTVLTVLPTWTILVFGLLGNSFLCCVDEVLYCTVLIQVKDLQRCNAGLGVTLLSFFGNSFLYFLFMSRDSVV